MLLDLHMPGKDGYAFIEAFSARDELAGRVPVIAVSAYVPERTDWQAQGGPSLFFDCLTKPVHYDVLRDTVQRALAASGDTATTH